MTDQVAANVVTSENRDAFMAQRLGLNTEVTEAPVQGEPEEKVIESEKPADSDTTATEKPNKLEKRFSEITKQREEAKAEAKREREAREALQRQLDELKTGKTAETPVIEEFKEPKREDYTDAFDYARDLADYAAKNAIKQQQQTQSRQAVVDNWNDQLERVRGEIEDFDEVMAATPVMVSDELRDTVIESGKPELFYEIANNPELADKLNGLNGKALAREIGKLEAKLEKAEPKKEEAKPVETVATVSKAPPPIAPVTAASTADVVPLNEKGDFTGNFAQYKAARKAGKIR